MLNKQISLWYSTRPRGPIRIIRIGPHVWKRGGIYYGGAFAPTAANGTAGVFPGKQASENEREI